MRPKKDRFIKILAGILVIAGISLMLLPRIGDHIVRTNTENLLKTTDEEMRINREKEGEINFADVQEISANTVIRTSLGSNDGVYVIGRIRIEAVNVDLPIVNSLTDQALHVGAGIMANGQVMGQGNYALAGHHMRNPNLLFSPLDRVKLGDKIVISDDTGSFTYKITETRVIPPTEVSVLEEVEGKAVITLITCANGGEDRLMVRGELIK